MGGFVLNTGINMDVVGIFSRVAGSVYSPHTSFREHFWSSLLIFANGRDESHYIRPRSNIEQGESEGAQRKHEKALDPWKGSP